MQVELNQSYAFLITENSRKCIRNKAPGEITEESLIGLFQL